MTSKMRPRIRHMLGDVLAVLLTVGQHLEAIETHSTLSLSNVFKEPVKFSI